MCRTMDKSKLFCMFQVVVALSFSSCFFYSYFSKSYIWWPRSSVTTPQLHYSALSLLREFAAEQTCKPHDVISLSNYQVRSSAVMLRTEATRNSRSIHAAATDRPDANSTELVTSQLLRTASVQSEIKKSGRTYLNDILPFKNASPTHRDLPPVIRL